jgi:hypothetical protein
MDFIYKKTHELSTNEKDQICAVFAQVFEGHTKNIAEFNSEFCNTVLGYSYHGLIINDDEIVGSHSFIPFKYYFDNSKYLFALGVDTMILKQHRNFDNIYDIWSLGRTILKKDGISCLFGFPNENSYPLSINGFGDNDIGTLSTYILPYKIGAVKPNLKFFDILSRFLSKMMISISCFSTNRTIIEYRIHKDREEFDKTRYKWFNGEYEMVQEQDFSFVYKIKNHEGIDTAFLIDIHPMSKRNFDKAVRMMYIRSRKLFEIALYIGNLNFSPLSMIKLPKKLEPKTFHFTGKILDTSLIDSDVFSTLKYWDVNLSNYDLL